MLHRRQLFDLFKFFASPLPARAGFAGRSRSGSGLTAGLADLRQRRHAAISLRRMARFGPENRFHWQGDALLHGVEQVSLVREAPIHCAPHGPGAPRVVTQAGARCPLLVKRMLGGVQQVLRVSAASSLVRRAKSGFRPE